MSVVAPCDKTLRYCKLKVNKKVPYTLDSLKAVFLQYYGLKRIPSAKKRQQLAPQLKTIDVRRFICYQMQHDTNFCNFVHQNAPHYMWTRPSQAQLAFCRSDRCKFYDKVRCPLNNQDLSNYWLKAGGKLPTKVAAKKKGGLRAWLISELRRGKGETGQRFCALVAADKRLQPPKPAIKYPPLSLPFEEFQARVNEEFARFRYPVPEYMDGCQRDPSKLLAYSPHQRFVRHYLTPRAPYNGLLVWHDVGTGKTCAAIATISSSFEREGWSILWITRSRIKVAPLQAMFKDICHHGMRELVKAGKQEVGKLRASKYAEWQKYFQMYAKWGTKGGFNVRNMTYREFVNFLGTKLSKTRRSNLGVAGQKDPLRRTIVVIDEAHNLYNDADLPETEAIGKGCKGCRKQMEDAIWNSYKTSGDDGVRLLLLTATPILNDPTSLPKLLNLMIPDPSARLPTTLDGLRSRYGTDAGARLFQHDSKGLISYFSGSKDPRFFALKNYMGTLNVVVTPLQQDAINKCLGRAPYSKQLTKTGKMKKVKAGNPAKNKLKCLRGASNFGTSGLPPYKFILDSASYSAAASKKEIWDYFPKARALLDTINQLDAQDMQREGKLYKHVIYTDVKEGGLGTKILATAFIADGYKLTKVRKIGSGPGLRMELDTEGNSKVGGHKTFAILCTSAIKGKQFFVGGAYASTPPDVAARLKIAEATKSTFNSRPDNVHGKNVRFLMLDSGFKEGVDVFDVKYIHLLEPPLSRSSLIQAVGRGVRRCGQAGLPYVPNQGWTVYIQLYQSQMLEPEGERAFQLSVQSDPDAVNGALIDRLSKLAIQSAVDYDLNRNILEFAGAGNAEQTIIQELGIP